MLIFVSSVLIFFKFFFLGTFIMASFYLYEDEEDDELEIDLDQYGTEYVRYNIDDLESALYRIKRLEGIHN